MMLDKREKDSIKLAEYNRQLQQTLEGLERAVPHTKNLDERERGLAMIRRLKTELGYELKKDNGESLTSC